MTTSATGDRGGFTLIEILLTLALVALLSWVFIGGSTALLAGPGLSPDEQFWKACGEARKEALERQKDVLLSFDPKQHGFVLSDGTDSRVLRLMAPEDTEVDFHPADSDSSSSTLVGGTLVDSTPLSSATFYSDGTCTPFRAQLRTASGAHLLSVDPWTCAPVIGATDATP
jgi:general secretion pathway protein H